MRSGRKTHRCKWGWLQVCLSARNRKNRQDELNTHLAHLLRGRRRKKVEDAEETNKANGLADAIVCQT